MRDHAIYRSNPEIVTIIEGNEAYDKDGNRVEIDESRVDDEIRKIKKEHAVKMPSIADQLDALWMQLNKDRLDGKDLVSKANDVLGKILAVKKQEK